MFHWSKRKETKTCQYQRSSREFVEHRREVVKIDQFSNLIKESKTPYPQGLERAVDILDEVIATIRGSDTREEAKQGLIAKFDFFLMNKQSIS